MIRALCIETSQTNKVSGPLTTSPWMACSRVDFISGAFKRIDGEGF